MCQRGFAHPGDILDQQMAAAKQGDQQVADGQLLACHGSG